MDWSLVERVHETEALYALIGGRSRGDGRVVVIEGAAGVGKTRLLGEARGRARGTRACWS